MTSHLYQEIPWAMSGTEPCELITSKDMTPAQRKIAIRDGQTCLGSWKTDRCQRCGQYYVTLVPDCVNYREHEEVATRLEAEKEAETVLGLRG